MDVRLQAPTAAREGIAWPRVSVVVPARNDPKRLAKCLEALRRSTLTDFEVIVADDASTDDTPRVAELMGARVVRLDRQSGAAAARNAAAKVARGEILMFVDADVCVHPDTLAVAWHALENPQIDAVFGSYDLDPGEPNLLSQYKNLAHRFYHQISGEEASTFWTGCGAIRREVFDQYKFDALRFARPSIEDIDLGARMIRDGRHIRIDKNLQAKHLKRWTLTGIVRSDVFDRALPWTRLILREKHLPTDLNLSIGQRIAALLAVATTAIFLIACCFRPWLAVAPFAIFGAVALADRWTQRRSVSIAIRAFMALLIVAGAIAAVMYAGWWCAAIAAPVGGVVLLNIPFYRFFLTHRGLLFTTAVLPMHLAYYLYGLGAFAVAHVIEFDEQRSRFRLYAAMACALYIVAWALVIVRAQVKHTTIDFAVSDATGFYAYLPSMVIDHDLDFDNQVKIQYRLLMDTEYEKAMKHNRWPIGVALSVAPGFLMGHGAAVVLYRLTGSEIFQPHGYSPIYFVFVVAWALMLGMLSLMLMDRLLSERFNMRGPVIVAAVLTTWLGTNYLWYFVREPLMAHMIGAVWITAAVFLIHRIETNARDGRLIWWHLPALAFVMSLAICCRLPNGFLVPMFIYLAIVLVRHRLYLRALKFAPLVLLACTPLLLDYFITQRNIGHPTAAVAETQSAVQALGYDPRERFYFTHPALLRVLFSSRHGLFFSTPVYLLSVIGLIWCMRRRSARRDGVLGSLIISALLLWYVNSAWYAWWMGPSVGHRGFVELAVLFTIGLGFFFTWMSELRLRMRNVMLGVLALCFAMNYAIMAAKLFDLVGENDSLIPFEDKILGDQTRI